jgi:hypothetical protein
MIAGLRESPLTFRERHYLRQNLARRGDVDLDQPSAVYPQDFRHSNPNQRRRWSEAWGSPAFKIAVCDTHGAE